MKQKTEHPHSTKANTNAHEAGINGKLAALAQLLGKLCARDVHAAQAPNQTAQKGSVTDEGK